MTLNNAPDGRRRTVLDDLLGELTRWGPREREGAFRSWLRNSVSLVHLHVLTVLESHGPLPMGRLAEALDVSVAAATGIVDRMEERELVERRTAADDRRVVMVHPTGRGAAMFEALAEERRKVLQPILERMSDEEIAACLTGLRAMRRIRVQLLDPPPADAPADAPATSDPRPGPAT